MPPEAFPQNRATPARDKVGLTPAKQSSPVRRDSDRLALTKAPRESRRRKQDRLGRTIEAPPNISHEDTFATVCSKNKAATQ